jgi:hypothetical protein
VPFLPLTSVLVRSSEQQARDFPNDASELPQGVTLGDVRCDAGSALQFVCCVFGVIPNAKTRSYQRHPQ